MYPSERRVWEAELVDGYYAALKQKGVDGASYSRDQCFRDYISGGIGRWVWLLALLSGMCPDDWVQFFHDQVLAFILDHNITPENIVMPRV